MKYHKLGNTGYNVSYIGYGGVVSSQHFDKAFIPGDGQKMSDQSVAWAIEQGVNYFDVAPTYGDALALMGNSLKPWRSEVYLACKTNKRTRAEAEPDMREALKLLHTDYFDVFQLHGISTMEELETCFAPGGAMELLIQMKKNGTARRIGITAHNEAAALRALELFDFDTVMFPFNWHMHMAHNMGERLRLAIKEKRCGQLGIKSMIERAWDESERYNSIYPKSWCKPFDIETEPSLLIAAMKYAVSLGIEVLVPPGNIDHFKFAVEHFQEVFEEPLTDDERTLLAEHLPKVKDHPFMEPECYA